MLDKLRSRDFAPYLNQRFRIHAGFAEPVEAELIEVTDVGRRPEGMAGEAKRTPFSLVFRGPKDIVLPQRIYRVEHAGIGDLELFLVPIGPDEAGMRYEALFG